jgi:hypothetical protein
MALFPLSGCHSAAQPPAAQPAAARQGSIVGTHQGSAYHPPDIQTQGLQPTSEPTDVTLTADGFFTEKGMKISFLRECAETTLKDGYDSFKLLDYSLTEPRPRHKVANGSIIEIRGKNEDLKKQIYDARRVQTDQYF